MGMNLLARNHKCLRERVRKFVVFPFWFGYDACQKRGGAEEMGHVVTKSDLVQVVAKAGNLSKAAAGEAVNAMFDAIVENVAKGKRVTVVGFGSYFSPKKQRKGAGARRHRTHYYYSTLRTLHRAHDVNEISEVSPQKSIFFLMLVRLPINKMCNYISHFI